MNAIKIEQKNAEKIVAALAEINGKATAHTFTTFADVQRQVDSAEKQLAVLLKKKDWAGAVSVVLSGHDACRAYKYPRVGTQIRIERRPSGWFLTEIEEAKLFSKGGDGRGLIYLSEEQTEAAKAHLLTKFLTLNASC